MKTKLVSTIVLLLLVANMLPIMSCTLPNSLAQEDFPFGVLDETGTHFELQQFNIFITTDTTVHIMLHACSEFMYFCIENAGNATSTRLVFGTLKPTTAYYLYEDGYENEKAFVTDDVGCYTYDQDLSQLHFIIIQPTPGTVIIDKSTTLQSNIYDAVSIGASNIVLDLNGYNITGGWGIGIDIFRRTNVTIKNGGINNFIAGMAITSSTNIVVNNCTISQNWWMGISFMASSKSNIVVNNTLAQNGGTSVELSTTSNNKFYHNNFDGRVSVYQLGGPNIWDDGYPSGGNYWSFYSGTDQYSGPDQNIPGGGDGIGDTPLIWPLNNIDNYPLMSPWTGHSSIATTTVQKGPHSYTISMASNSTISNIQINPSKLDFTVTGETGTSGYVRATLPVGLFNTDLKVFLNNKMMKPPPYPVITTNGTHYFVYFVFQFKSSYEVTILFEPVTAVIDIDPDTLNLKSSGMWITCYIELPDGYDVSDIDVSSILLNKTISAETTPTSIGDWDHDGIPDLMVKLDRAEVISYIIAHINMTELEEEKFMTIILTLTFELHNGIPFLGSDTMRIIMHTTGGGGRNALLK